MVVPGALRLGALGASALAALFVLLALALPSGYFAGSKDNLPLPTGDQQNLPAGLKMSASATVASSIWSFTTDLTLKVAMEGVGPAELEKQLAQMGGLPKFKMTATYASDDCPARKGVIVGGQACAVLALLGVVAASALTAFVQWGSAAAKPALLPALRVGGAAVHGGAGLLAFVAGVLLLAGYGTDFGEGCVVDMKVDVTGMPVPGLDKMGPTPMRKLSEDGLAVGAGPVLLILAAVLQGGSAALCLLAFCKKDAASPAADLVDSDDDDASAEMPSAVNEC